MKSVSITFAVILIGVFMLSGIRTEAKPLSYPVQPVSDGWANKGMVTLRFLDPMGGFIYSAWDTQSGPDGITDPKLKLSIPADIKMGPGLNVFRLTLQDYRPMTMICYIRSSFEDATLSLGKLTPEVIEKIVPRDGGQGEVVKLTVMSLDGSACAEVFVGDRLNIDQLGLDEIHDKCTLETRLILPDGCSLIRNQQNISNNSILVTNENVVEDMGLQLPDGSVAKVIWMTFDFCESEKTITQYHKDSGLGTILGLVALGGLIASGGSSDVSTYSYGMLPYLSNSGSSGDTLPTPVMDPWSLVVCNQVEITSEMVQALMDRNWIDIDIKAPGTGRVSQSLRIGVE
jgi:hypothetical protein